MKKVRDLTARCVVTKEVDESCEKPIGKHLASSSQRMRTTYEFNYLLLRLITVRHSPKTTPVC